MKLQAYKIREMNENERREELNNLRRQLFEQVSSVQIGLSSDDPMRIRQLKRSIARLKTIMNEYGESE